MKSHDRIIVSRGFWSVLTELNQFYRDLCSPKLSIAYIKKLEKDIAILLCKLEKKFSPALFLCHGTPSSALTI